MYRILSCDDDPDILDVIEITFTSEGFDVITASDGKTGWDIVQKEHIDVAILDYIMPELNGIELCKRIKNDPLLSQIPVLLVTGKGETEDKLLGLESGADDYIVKPFEPQELVARVRNLLNRTRLILDTNPLTRLPGNNAITQEINKKLQMQSPFAVAYIDLNQFKAYNDKYGFTAGDEVIQFTAKILLMTSREVDPNAFVGHIGGDDFVVISSPEKIEQIAQKVIERFDSEIKNFYDPEAREKGYIETLGRDRVLKRFPIISISISIADSQRRKFTHVGEIAQVAAEVKKKVKTFGKSAYLIDRRSG